MTLKNASDFEKLAIYRGTLAIWEKVVIFKIAKCY